MNPSDFLSSENDCSTPQSSSSSTPSRNDVLPPPVPGVVKENLLRKKKGQYSWLISLALHGGVLLCLAGITIDPQLIHAPAIQIEQPILEPEPEFVFCNLIFVLLPPLFAVSPSLVTVPVTSTPVDVVASFSELSW